MVIQTLNEVISQKYALAARNALDAINEDMSPSERGPLMHEANHRLHQAICSLWGSALPPRRIRAEWRPASRTYVGSAPSFLKVQPLGGGGND